MYLVGARPHKAGAKLVGAPVTLAQVAATELVIPPRPHSIRMLLDSALADAGLKARVALEIESVPTLLDLVQHDGFHAVLTLNAIRRSGNEDALPGATHRQAAAGGHAAPGHLGAAAGRPADGALDRAGQGAGGAALGVNLPSRRSSTPNSQ